MLGRGRLAPSIEPAEGEAKPGRLVPPTECHQLAAAIALHPMKPIRLRLVVLFASGIVTLMQLLALMAAYRSHLLASCLTNADCGTRFTYCRVSTQRCDLCKYGYGGACEQGVTAEMWLARQPTDMASVNSRTYPELRDYASHCAACLSADDDQYSWASAGEYNNVALMDWRDWLALVFVSFIVGLSLADEVRGIKFCEVALAQSATTVGLGWRLAVGAIAAVRQYAVATSLFVSVVIAIFAHGGGIASVCFNAVALLFLLEVDDAILAHAVPETARAWCTTLATVRVDDADLRVVSCMKLAYIALCTVGIPLGTAWRLRLPNTGGYEYTSDCLFVLFFATIVVNAAEPLALVGMGDGHRRVARRLATVIARWTFGFGMWLVCLNFL